MNIFNLNKTLYNKNFDFAFYKFCLKKHFGIIRYAIVQLWALGMYLLGFWSKLKLKEKFYSFLKGLKDTDELIIQFWAKEEKNINHNLLKNSETVHILITESPRFLVESISQKYNLKLIASDVDKTTGKHLTLCDKDRKLAELKKLEQNFENAYASTLNDAPILALAKNSYIVTKDSIVTVQDYKPSFMVKFKENFFSVEFFQFLVVGVINTVNSTIVATLFSLILQANVAFICGYIISLCIAYILNSIWIFKQPIRFKKFVMFAVSYIPNFIIQNTIVFLLFNLAGLNKILVYALAAIIGIPVTFICVKVLCFLKKKKSEN